MDHNLEDPRSDELADCLDRVHTRLNKPEDAHWAERFARAAQLIRTGNARGLYLVLEAFGGMGSIQDRMWDSEMQRALSDIWARATELRREHERVNRSSK